MSGKSTDPVHLASAQYASPANLRARWHLHDRYTFPPVQIQRHAVARLCLTGDEDVLDVGCGEGATLHELRARLGHRGRLAGVDLNGAMFAETDAAQRLEKWPPIEFHVGSADALPLPDRCFDVVLSLFMLYHMPQIDAALREWKRVLRPGGRLVVSTFGENHRPKFWAHRRMLAHELSRLPLSRLSAPFTLENGQERLTRSFAIQETFVSEGQLRTSDVEAYLAGLGSIRDLFDPAPADDDWTRAMNAVRSEVEREIDQTGLVVDDSRRGYFICSV